jgi:CDP-diacylglycerol--glycerol-3-phosphate 3-phosphatidyltransferase
VAAGSRQAGTVGGVSSPRTPGVAEARLRRGAAVALERLGNPLARPTATRIDPDTVTAAGIACAAAASIATAVGLRRSATALWVAANVADVADGALARGRRDAGGGSDARGAVTDSTADRATDALIALGVAAGALRRGRTLTALAATAAGLSGALPAHVSAKAAAVGYDPPRHAPGRLERSGAWTIAVAAPVTAGPVCAAICVANLSSAWRRWRSLERTGPQ